MRKLLWLFVSCLLLAGCAKPLPPDKAAYAGEWRGPTMALIITMGGNVMYKRTRGDVHTSINGPLAAFEGDSFVVGIGPLKTTFAVSVPPHREDGRWSMTVDGETLARVPPGN